MRGNLILTISAIVIALFGLSACQSGNSTPTKAVQTMAKAIKEKDVKTFKSLIPKKELEKEEDRNKKNNKNYDEELKQILESMSGRLSDDFSFETRNEKINGDTATVEVNVKGEEKWETLTLIKEDDGWKLKTPLR